MDVLDLEKQTYSLPNLLNHEPDIDKLFLCVKDPYKAKYQLLINKRQDRNLKYFNNSKAFIEYWNDMNKNYKNIKNIAQIRNVKY